MKKFFFIPLLMIILFLTRLYTMSYSNLYEFFYFLSIILLLIFIIVDFLKVIQKKECLKELGKKTLIGLIGIIIITSFYVLTYPCIGCNNSNSKYAYCSMAKCNADNTKCAYLDEDGIEHDDLDCSKFFRKLEN